MACAKRLSSGILFAMRNITIALPDFSAMNDDEVEDHVLTGARDGRWSSSTRWLMKKFGTSLVELNDAWAQMRTRWSCPVCDREKFQIARLTDQNVLLCQLDVHHDHIADQAKEFWRTRLPEDLPDEISATRRRAFANIYPLIERFSRTLICNDCNAADAAMKAAIGAEVPRHFSFSPSEIARFIIAAPNSPHLLDLETGREIWAVAHSQYQERVAFIALMADRICQGAHDRERVRIAVDSPFEGARMFLDLAREQLPVRERPVDLAEALLIRSRSTAGKSSAVPGRPKSKVRIPSAADFAKIDAARNEVSRPWRDAGATWNCASCDRTKFEIMRGSNSGAWTANIMLVHDFDEELDPESRRRRSALSGHSLIFSNYRKRWVCQDCRQIISDAVTLIPEADQYCLGTTDLRSLVLEPRAHQRHDVERSAIITYVEQNGDWRAAAADFWMHREEATIIYWEQYKLTYIGVPVAEARRSAISHLVSSGKIPVADADGWFDWFVRERQRLSDDTEFAR
jgi:rubredoxin